MKQNEGNVSDMVEMYTFFTIVRGFKIASIHYVYVLNH